MSTAIIRYIQLMNSIPRFSPIPKVHLAFHLVRRLVFLGAPKSYATWKDDAENKVLKGTCRGASQLTFEATVLSRMAFVLNPSSSSGLP